MRSSKRATTRPQTASRTMRRTLRHGRRRSSPSRRARTTVAPAGQPEQVGVLRPAAPEHVGVRVDEQRTTRRRRRTASSGAPPVHVADSAPPIDSGPLPSASGRCPTAAGGAPARRAWFHQRPPWMPASTSTVPGGVEERTRARSRVSTARRPSRNAGPPSRGVRRQCRSTVLLAASMTTVPQVVE